AQGLRLSESEMAQKSWPSGAPSRAAAACIAVTPGATAMSRRRHSGASWVAAGDDGYRAAFRRKLQGEPGALHFLPVVAWVGALILPQAQAIEIGAIADDVACRRNGCTRFRRHPLSRART